MLLPSSALASEPTSGYTQTPTTSKSTPTTGVSPSKETKPSTTPEPTTTVAPTTTTPATEPKASTLPFTGFDLRWDIGFGVVLLGAGISILAMQRRQRRRSER